MCVLGFLGIGIKMLTEEGLIRLNMIFHYILRPLFLEFSSTTSLRLFRAARILIVRARIAHGEINVWRCEFYNNNRHTDHKTLLLLGSFVFRLSLNCATRQTKNQRQRTTILTGVKIACSSFYFLPSFKRSVHSFLPRRSLLWFYQNQTYRRQKDKKTKHSHKW